MFRQCDGWMAGLWCSLMIATAASGGAQQVPQSPAPKPVSRTPAQTSSQMARDNAGQPEARVSIDLDRVRLSEALAAVQRQSGITISYSAASVPVGRIVSLHVQDISVTEAVRRLLQGTNVRVSKMQDGGLLLFIDGSERAETGTIAGRVVDSASGRGLGGATVTVEKTKLTATTSDSGLFSLANVPVGEQTVVIKMLGYQSVTRRVTVAAGKDAVVRVSLPKTVTVLSGVVTTATGVQQRQKIGNDITVLNADSIQRVAPVSTITDLLETRVPGLVVMHTSGVPGAPSRLRLRGTGSAEQSNDPIVYVNGMRVYADQSGSTNVLAIHGSSSVGSYPTPSPLDQIDPNSIATIEVFKGPSAAAMYGADAGNGVIVITTKKGQAGQTKWMASADQGFSSLPGSYPLNYYQFGRASYNSASLLCQHSVGEVCLLDSTVAYQALNDPRISPISHGTSQQASATVSGGTGALLYSVTGSSRNSAGVLRLPAIEAAAFEHQSGLPAPDWMTHPDHYTTVGGSGDMTLGFGHDGGTIGLTSSVFRSNQQQSSLQNLLGALLGTYVDTNTAHLLGLNAASVYHKVNADGWTLNDAAQLNWPIRPWLPVRGTLGLNYENTAATDVEPRDYNPNDTLGSYSKNSGTSIIETLGLGTTFSVPRIHHLLAIQIPVSLTVTTQSLSQFSGVTTGLNIGEMEPTQYANCPGSTGCVTQSTVKQSTYGWSIQPTFDFASRLFISPGFRFDGGSASGRNAEFSPFPKVDVSWLAIDGSNGGALGGALTLLRPRIAFGIAGVQPNPGDQLRLYRYVTATDENGLPTNVAILSTLGNTHLHPERSQELEGGVDAELWDQRVTIRLTGYDKVRHDALLSLTAAPSLGLGVPQNVVGETSTQIQQNVGDFRNRGFEAELTARLLDQSNLDWSVTTAITKNSNRVLSLASGFVQDCRGPSVQSGLSCIAVGYPLDGRWALPITGFADANGNGRIDPNEVQIGDSAVFVGGSEPNYELTMSTQLSFWHDRLSINTSVDYQNGMTQTDFSSFMQGSTGSPFFAPNATLAQQAAVVAGGPNTTGTRTIIGLMQVVNTLRWNDLSVTYQAPPSVARAARVASLSISLQGSNLALHTNYHGKDPSVNAFTNGNFVADYGQLPQSREWRLRISLGN